MGNSLEEYRKTLEQNKQLARTWWNLFNKEDWNSVEEMLTDDFVWRTIASPRPFQSEMLKGQPTQAVDRDKKTTMEVFRSLPTAFNPQYRRTIYGLMTAEDDRVSYEAKGSGVLARTGHTYDQRYHDLIVVRGGKVAEFHEYQDLLHVYDIGHD